MASIPQRHYRVWQAWLVKQWNKPTRQDYLLMRIAQQVRMLCDLTLAIATTKPGQQIAMKELPLEDMDVRFNIGSATASASGNGEQNADDKPNWQVQKAYWMAYLSPARGRKLKVRLPTGKPGASND